MDIYLFQSFLAIHVEKGETYTSYSHCCVHHNSILFYGYVLIEQLDCILDNKKIAFIDRNLEVHDSQCYDCVSKLDDDSHRCEAKLKQIKLTRIYLHVYDI